MEDGKWCLEYRLDEKYVSVPLDAKSEAEAVQEGQEKLTAIRKEIDDRDKENQQQARASVAGTFQHVVYPFLFRPYEPCIIYRVMIK